MPDDKNTETEIAKLVRHDRHLWWIAVLVMLALTATIIGVYAPQLVSESKKDLILQLKTYLYGLSILILLFCLYVLRVSYNFGRLRSQLTQKEIEKAEVQGKSEELMKIKETLERENYERKLAEKSLHKSEARFSGILDIAYEAIISIDERQQIILFNKRAEQLFGYSQDETVGQPLDFLLPERSQAVHRHHIAAFSSSTVTARGMGERGQIYGRRKNGEEFPAEASISKLELGGEKIFAVVLRDITYQERWEHSLYKQAICDTLTGLYNRRYFESRMEEEIARADRDKQMLAILLCDLDHFKTVNDSRGHQAGDEVLKEVARSIQESSRGTDLVFRWGGDEIVVILSKTTREGVMFASKRIREGIRKVSAAARLDLDISIGAALYPVHGKNVDELIRLADRALYIAKKGGDKIHIGEASTG